MLRKSAQFGVLIDIQDPDYEVAQFRFEFAVWSSCSSQAGDALFTIYPAVIQESVHGNDSIKITMRSS